MSNNRANFFQSLPPPPPGPLVRQLSETYIYNGRPTNDDPNSSAFTAQERANRLRALQNNQVRLNDTNIETKDDNIETKEEKPQNSRPR